VCATFFCKHVAGATGHAFWTALRRYLYHVERTLARYAATSVAPTLREPGLPRHQLTREDLEDKPARDYEATWGTWAGREEAFYVACAEHVGSLDRDAFVRVVDEPGAALLSAATLAYEAVATPKLAPRLVLNREMGVVTAAGGVGVTWCARVLGEQ
jgi:hypothetical protein